VISVAANEVPGPLRAMVAACRKGDFAEGRRLHNRLLRLMNLNFVESNPIPVKAALALMGLCEESYRLPLAPPSQATRDALAAALRELELLA
jgi:4-hydroxy-tetrahydrodipicolinate synthase